ncbi:MAG: hypothetical protein J6A41_01240 [Ruminiclostridium sp.]|nr:hypothetical protein [Ruminiclostridium sp.]
MVDYSDSTLWTNFWNDFDFSDCENILYCEPYLAPYMLEVAFPHKLTLIAGFDELFFVTILWDTGNRPVAEYSCNTQEDFKKLIETAIKQIHEEIKTKRLSYYGPLWETIRIDLR